MCQSKRGPTSQITSGEYRRLSSSGEESSHKANDSN